MKKILPLTTLFCILVFWLIWEDHPKTIQINKHKKQHFNGPAEFAKFHRDIRTREGEDKPAYKTGYKFAELTKAKNQAALFRKGARMQDNGVTAWTERGPANVPGRTRGLIVDPDDATKNTWFAGSVGGGVWKTFNAGQSWTWLTPDLPNLSTTVLAMAESNHDIIYLGTGEGFGNVDGIDGAGIFKSTNRGVSWSQLSSTSDFSDVNRIIVDPSNASIVIAATNFGIYRTINGGDDWTKVYQFGAIQDLKASPDDFNIQYASVNSVGVLKSIDGGQTWDLSSTGMNPSGRIELAVSPVDPQQIFASAEGGVTGSESDLYVSSNGAISWSLVNVKINNVTVELLGDDSGIAGDSQGWYDNTIVCDPFDRDVIYVGGIDLFRIDVGSTTTDIDNYTMIEGTLGFISLINFSAQHYGGRLEVGSIPEKFSVEVRFGSGQSQKAHRFLVPEGRTSGVADIDYSFQNYVDIPFEVWDITNNKQLMVSFRDQDRNGSFNLYEANTSSTTATEQSREYLFIHNVEYSDTENTSIATDGGQTFDRKYFFWPVLANGAEWTPDTWPNPVLAIQHSTLELFNSTTEFITDGRNRFGNSSKNENLHVDHHNLVAIPMSGSTFKILNANDGGVYVSNTSATPGVNHGDWTDPTIGFNTGQFYGADKRPGKDQYLGGLQDNGTWFSQNNETASPTTEYTFAIGGDGFEVLWNNLDDQLLIGGFQGNGFRRSTNGGQGWSVATNGLTGDFPFISKLANSKDLPNRIFTVGSSGVFVSNNFGQNWTLRTITEKWGGASTFADVEVSRANANIIWAGNAMSDDYDLYLSVDGGQTFSSTNNYTTEPLGSISKLASHPTQPGTAYALFSFAGAPKILRTTDFGQTWEDISGFEGVNESTNGFPDVAVYCLYVRPDDPNIIWAGTEIGIVESQNNGQSWALIEDFPNVSVWDMKGQDDQVVIATHGRGIWTATIDSSTPQANYVKIPSLVRYGTTPQKNLAIQYSFLTDFDSVEFYVGSTIAGVVGNIASGDIIIELSGIGSGDKTINTISYKDGAPYQGSESSVSQLNLLSTETNYVEFFNTTTDVISSGFTQQVFTGEPNTYRKALQSTHDYGASKEHTAIVAHPVIVAANNATITYRDIAIVEPDEDYVVMEATKNGLDWIALTNQYDANSNPTWLATYNAGGDGSRDMFVDHTINLHDFFNAGDTILVRYRLSSDATGVAWGVAVDYIAIQDVVLTNETTIKSDPAFKIFPNPTKGEFYVQYKANQNAYPSLQILDSQGRIIQSRNLVVKDAEIQTEKVTLTTGSYVVVLNDRQRKRTGKVVVTN
ncbi:MAG: T9SS type A sorting domain-containing protein [Flammeovirgaceae bacterium]|nr:T9SS type A sorting domain-containing protein [Flammeovirgaceae bacterium]